MNLIDKKMEETVQKGIERIKDIIGESNALYHYNEKKYVFFSKKDDIRKDLLQLKDVEMKMIGFCPYFFSRTLFNKRGIREFQLVHCSFSF